MRSPPEKVTHPSFGLVEICRVSGSPGPLFGSSVECRNTIRLRIHRAATRREYHSTWYSDEGELIEVELSPNQWAECLTTLNTSPGTPCTIRRLAGQSVEGPPAVNVREQHRREFETDMKRVAERFDDDIKAVRTILAKPTVNKGDRTAILASLDRLRMELASNTPFVHRQFDEAVAEAKGEIDAFLTHAVVSAGRLAIAERMATDQLARPVVTVPALSPAADNPT